MICKEKKDFNVITVGWNTSGDVVTKVGIAVGKTGSEGNVICRHWFTFQDKENLKDTISTLQSLAAKMK